MNCLDEICKNGSKTEKKERQHRVLDIWISLQSWAKYLGHKREVQ